MRKVAIVGAGMTAFGEHFALGIKDLLPMAFADCAKSVDKGLAKSDVQAAWYGAMGTADGFRRSRGGLATLTWYNARTWDILIGWARRLQARRGHHARGAPGLHRGPNFPSERTR